MLNTESGRPQREGIDPHFNLDWVPNVSVHTDQPGSDRVTLPYDLPGEAITIEEMKHTLQLLQTGRADEVAPEHLSYCAETGLLQYMTPHAYSAIEDQIRELNTSAGKLHERTDVRDLASNSLSATRQELETLARKELPGKWWQFWHTGKLNPQEQEHKQQLLERQEIQVQVL